ncbi:MAG: hypothetical protein CSA22_08955 [Deltaproteobacteria bacterium]|nr:MAG: hypothetical protein CSA22_08955 [Deltaproteobacteria bacterium]
MATGSISSLGVGSGFELQSMIEQLREVDEAPIRLKAAQQEMMEAKLTEYDALNAKILSMKSKALTLSLSSNFIERSVESSDTEILSATAQTGANQTQYDITVNRIAKKSSWQSDGVAEKETLVYAAPQTGITDPDQAAVSTDTALSFTIGPPGAEKTVSLTLAAGSSLNEMADAINTHAANQNADGRTVVTASVVKNKGQYAIRLASTNTDAKTNNQILVADGPAFVKPDLTFAYKLGESGDTIYTTVTMGMSYQDLANQINTDTANTGIIARLIDDGSANTPYKLTLTSKATGEDNRIFIDGLAMTEVQGAGGESLNAELVVNGVTLQRQTNTGIDDVAQGLTLKLNKAGDATLSVKPETAAIKETITELITTFKDVLADIQSKNKYDKETESYGPFSQESDVRLVQSQLVDLMSTRLDTGGSINSLFDLGMELSEDGTISLNESVLDTVLSTQMEDVQKLFISDTDTGTTGLGDLFNESLRTLTSATGALESRKTALQEQIDRADESIQSTTERLDKKYETLAKQFVQLDAAIGTLKNQGEYLTSIFDAYKATFRQD